MTWQMPWKPAAIEEGGEDEAPRASILFKRFLSLFNTRFLDSRRLCIGYHMKYAIKFAYDGRDFSGFQRQPDDRTVQGEIEKVLSIIFQEEVALHASGRTDTGVHALNQVATFCPAIFIKEEDLTRALRRMLPRDIKLVQLCRCSEDFHPRFDAIRKALPLYLLS